MRITADTNVLVRVLMNDDAEQARLARQVVGSAECVVIPLPVLCELVWVLARGYGVDRSEIAAALRALLDCEPVVTDRAGAEAGLSILEAGGDFADGAIAHSGRAVGGVTFVSFDAKAVALIAERGYDARSLA